MTRKEFQISQKEYQDVRKPNVFPPKYRRPFWLPASNYYILASAITIAAFFLLWGIFHDGDDPTPWIPAGIGASLILIGAVFLREIVLRKARNRFLIAQKRLDYNLRSISVQPQNFNENKISLKKNSTLLSNIKKKSEAARILARLPEGHLEVFEICDEYLNLTKNELRSVSPGSPRIGAFRRGREIAKALHKFHLLAWAEIESRKYTLEAQNRVTMAEKIETAQMAINVLNKALDYYPNERKIIESESVIKDLIVSMRVGHWIEQAERSAFKGNNQRAISHYKDALFFLARENQNNQDFEKIAEKINREIEKLKNIPTKKKIKNLNKKND